MAKLSKVLPIVLLTTMIHVSRQTTVKEMLKTSNPADLDLKDWMGLLDDATQINRLIIPGAHDAQSNEDFDGIAVFLTRILKTQHFNTTELLEKGFRALDERLCYKKNPPSTLQYDGQELQLCHGTIESLDHIASGQKDVMETFRDMLWNVKNFLKSYPSEVVIMILKAEDIDDIEVTVGPGENEEQKKGEAILNLVTQAIDETDPSDSQKFRDVLFDNSNLG